LEADSGKPIWSKNFNADYNSETPIWGYAAHPLVHGDTVYCIVYAVSGSIIFDESAIYRIDQSASVLIAVNREDGNRMWQTQEPVLAEVGSRVKHGTAFLVRYKDSNSYNILSESGDLIIVEITYDGYKELGRQHVLEPTNTTSGRPVVWSHPAFADRTMFARNDKKLIAFDLNESHYSQ
jgi:hypothetical protein